MDTKTHGQHANGASASAAEGKALIGVVICSLIGALGLWALSILVMIRLFPGDAWTTRGQVGDMFGAVNALFSGLAFVGVVSALVIQSRQMQAQSRDVAAQLTEMRIARDSQVQPFLAASLDEHILLNKPRLYASLGTRARLSFKLTVVNASQEPAINIRVSTALSAPGIEPLGRVSVVSMPLMPAKEDNRHVELLLPDQALAQGSDELLRTIAPDGSDSTDMPARWLLTISLSFQSTLGVPFEVDQQFALYIPEDKAELRAWISDAAHEEVVVNEEAPVETVRVSAYALPGTFKYRMMSPHSA